MTSKNAAIVIRQLSWNWAVLSFFENPFQNHICIFTHSLPYFILFFIVLLVNSIIITLLIPEHFPIFYILIRIHLA